MTLEKQKISIFHLKFLPKIRYF